MVASSCRSRRARACAARRAAAQPPARRIGVRENRSPRRSGRPRQLGVMRRPPEPAHFAICSSRRSRNRGQATAAQPAQQAGEEIGGRALGGDRRVTAADPASGAESRVRAGGRSRSRRPRQTQDPAVSTSIRAACAQSPRSRPWGEICGVSSVCSTKLHTAYARGIQKQRQTTWPSPPPPAGDLVLAAQNAHQTLREGAGITPVA